MQQQIRELTQRLDASFELTGPSFFPTRVGHKQVVAVSEAEGRLAQIATKKAALAQQIRQLEAEQQHEAEQGGSNGDDQQGDGAAPPPLGELGTCLGA